MTILALVLGSLAITWVCRRFDVSAPLVLVVAGIAVSFVPGVEIVEFDPEIVLLVVLTPLLYSAALESSYLDIRANRRPIGLLAIGLVTFTAVVVGIVAWWWVPELTLPVALVLGAIVAPPDAVSAISIGRRLGLPRRAMTILSGESLVNDATSLTLFRVFLTVATGSGITFLAAGGLFLYAAVGGTAIGYGLAWIAHRIHRRLNDPRVEAAFGLIVPFAVFIVAEPIAHTSGVLAVVVAGLYLGYHSSESGYATRLQEQAVWQASDTILESVVFALIGLQLTTVLAHVGDVGPLVVAGLVITAAVVIARIVWVFPATYLPRYLSRKIREREPHPPWRVPAVISWAGMRGVVTLAAAFTIAAEPFRNTVVFLAFFVTVATLLLHGLTLPWLIRKLGVHDTGGQADLLAEAQTQYDAVQASIERLDALVADVDVSTTVHTAEKLRRMAQMSANGVWEQLGRSDEEAGESPNATYRRLRREMLRSERATFVARRDSGDIDDEILRRVLRRLDLEEAQLARDDA